MGPSRCGHPEAVENFLDIDGPTKPKSSKDRSVTENVRSRDYGQAERAISNGKLNASPRLHIRPIKLVVFQCPS